MSYEAAMRAFNATSHAIVDMFGTTRPLGYKMTTFDWMLTTQHKKFLDARIPHASLFSQLHSFVNNPIFISLLKRKHGIFFIDFDDTICHNVYDDANNLIAASYNGATGEHWRKVLTMLAQNYALILLTNRIPYVGEIDGLIDWIIDGKPFSEISASITRELKVNLSGLFTAKLLTSRLCEKGMVMRYFLNLIHTKDVIMTPKQCTLIDDDFDNILSAKHFDFETIESGYLTQNFILRLEERIRSTSGAISGPPHPASPPSVSVPTDEPYYVLTKETLDHLAQGKTPPEYLLIR